VIIFQIIQCLAIECMLIIHIQLLQKVLGINDIGMIHDLKFMILVFLILYNGHVKIMIGGVN
jgi:hypothetical protein